MNEHVFTGGVDPVPDSGFGGPFMGLEFAYIDAATIQAKVASKAPDGAAHILMFDSTGAMRWFEFSGTQDIDIEVDGINGLETVIFNGAGELADHNYHVYVLAKPDGTVGFLIIDDDDYAGGPFGVGWALPTGYTYCSYPAHYLRNNSSSDFSDFYDSGGAFSFYDLGDGEILNAGSSTSFAATQLNDIVPVWARSYAVFHLQIVDADNWNLSHDGTNTIAAFGSINGSLDRKHIPLFNPVSLQYKRTGGVGTLTLWVPGWTR